MHYLYGRKPTMGLRALWSYVGLRSGPLQTSNWNYLSFLQRESHRQDKNLRFMNNYLNGKQRYWKQNTQRKIGDWERKQILWNEAEQLLIALCLVYSSWTIYAWLLDLYFTFRPLPVGELCWLALVNYMLVIDAWRSSYKKDRSQMRFTLFLWHENIDPLQESPPNMAKDRKAFRWLMVYVIRWPIR